MVELRPMRLEDVELLVGWDDDPDVATALGRPGAAWYDWSIELSRNVRWRELLIAEEDGRPFGFVQLTDAREEESHYWGDVDEGVWTVDIWIGSPHDRGRGLCTEVVRQAVRRNFEQHGAASVLVDPKVTNRRAIAVYERLGFESTVERYFDLTTVA
jgi:aminoglycoside 6'-N-acetyltransferase